MRILVCVLIIGLCSCGTGRVVIKKESYREVDRNEVIIQKFILEELRPAMSINKGVAGIELGINDNLEKTERLVQIYLDSLFKVDNGAYSLMTTDGQIDRRELAVGEILSSAILADILRGLVDFTTDYLFEERVPQPFNVLRQAKFGRNIWRTEEELRKKY